MQHPLNVNLREDAVIGRVDKWLAREFAPHRMGETLRALAEAPQRDTAPMDADDQETAGKIAECDRKLAQYRAALDAGETRPPLPRGSRRPKQRKRATRSSRAHTGLNRARA